MTELTDTARQRRRWAYKLIRRTTTPPPSYGSPGWLALPDGSPEKIAAVVVAAECWAVDGDEIVERLSRDLAAAEEAEDRRQDELHAENVEMVQRLATRPGIGTTYAQRRARELEDAKRPRPGDFPGRGVVCPFCDTPTSPWTCSCGQTRIGGAA